jgi:putative transposase
LLQEVLNRYVGQRIYRILDHAKIHHAQALAPFLADHAALHLVFLPPYSPNLNNVERLWKWLREKVILNTYFPNLGAIKEAVGRFLRFLEEAKTEIQSRLCRLPGDPKKT